jgi:hypothetical protein
MGRPGPQPQADIPNSGSTASRISPKPLDQWAKNPMGVSLRLWAFRTANYLGCFLKPYLVYLLRQDLQGDAYLLRPPERISLFI